MLTRRHIRRLAVMLVSVLGFAHASLALSACTMDRGDLSQVLGSQHMECCSEDGAGSLPMSANGCVSHCTSDLQHPGVPAAVLPASALILVFVLPDRTALPPDAAARIDERPPGAVPPRILLHSFLV